MTPRSGTREDPRPPLERALAIAEELREEGREEEALELLGSIVEALEAVVQARGARAGR